MASLKGCKCCDCRRFGCARALCCLVRRAVVAIQADYVVHGRAWALLYIKLLQSTALHTRRCVHSLSVFVCVCVCVNI